MLSLNACFFVLSCLLLATHGEVSAQSTYYVDQDATLGSDNGSDWDNAFLDLQSALAVALSGDEVRVAEGTYGPNPGHFMVKAGVTVRGGYAGYGMPDPDRRVVDLYVTTLTGDALGDDGPGFSNRSDNLQHVIAGGTGAAAVVLDGLTVRGGHATSGSFHPFGEGGGLTIQNGILRIIDCTFTDNDSGGFGGGLWAYQCDVTIVSTDFIANHIEYDDIADLSAGGAGACTWECTNTVVDSLFRGNSGNRVNLANARLGGIGLALELVYDTVVQHCRFIDNTATSFGISVGGVGLGVGYTAGEGYIADCEFIDNTATVSAHLDGGAGLLNGTPLPVVNCRFLGNICSAGIAGGLFTGGAVINCEFSGNVAVQGAGLVLDPYDSTPQPILNCTFSENLSAHPPAGAYVDDNVTMDNSILWGNHAGVGGTEVEQIGFASSPIAMNHCDIEGWTGTWGGSGNIGVEPKFVDADGADDTAGTEDDDLRLLAGSPCIDAADHGALAQDLADLDADLDSSEPQPIDLADRVRVFDDPGTVDSGAGTPPYLDMGAHEYGSDLPTDLWTDLGQGLAGSYGIPLLEGSGTVAPWRPVRFDLSNALESSPLVLFVGFSEINAPFRGGTLVPFPNQFFLGLVTDGAGNLTLDASWPDGLPPATVVTFQIWAFDVAGPFGLSASNAISATSPF